MHENFQSSTVGIVRRSSVYFYSLATGQKNAKKWNEPPVFVKHGLEVIRLAFLAVSVERCQAGLNSHLLCTAGAGASRRTRTIGLI